MNRVSSRVASQFVCVAGSLLSLTVLAGGIPGAAHAGVSSQQAASTITSVSAPTQFTPGQNVSVEIGLSGAATKVQITSLPAGIINYTATVSDGATLSVPTTALATEDGTVVTIVVKTATSTFEIETAAAGVQEPIFPKAGVQEPIFPKAGVQEPIFPKAGVQEPIFPEAGVQEPIFPKAGVQEPIFPKAGVQEPIFPKAGVQEPIFPKAGVQEPIFPKAGVQEPIFPKAGVQEPIFPKAGVQEPIFPKAGVQEPIFPKAGVQEPIFPKAGVQEPIFPGPRRVRPAGRPGSAKRP